MDTAAAPTHPPPGPAPVRIAVSKQRRIAHRAPRAVVARARPVVDAHGVAAVAVFDAREVTVLPRHWPGLAARPGGASVALRRFVEHALAPAEAAIAAEPAAAEASAAACGPSSADAPPPPTRAHDPVPGAAWSRA